MHESGRRRVEPTDEWEHIELLLGLPEPLSVMIASVYEAGFGGDMFEAAEDI